MVMFSILVPQAASTVRITKDGGYGSPPSRGRRGPSSARWRLGFAQFAKTGLIRTYVLIRKKLRKERRSMAGLGAKVENKVLAQPSWPDEVFRVLKEAGVKQVAMV